MLERGAFASAPRTLIDIPLETTARHPDASALEDARGALSYPPAPPSEPTRLEVFGEDVLNRRPRACEASALLLVAERIPSLSPRRAEHNAPVRATSGGIGGANDEHLV